MILGRFYPPGYVNLPLPRVQFIPESASAGTGEYELITWVVDTRPMIKA